MIIIVVAITKAVILESNRSSEQINQAMYVFGRYDLVLLEPPDLNVFK